jgi:hypothetical protein
MQYSHPRGFDILCQGCYNAISPIKGSFFCSHIRLAFVLSAKQQVLPARIDLMGESYQTPNPPFGAASPERAGEGLHLSGAYGVRRYFWK